MRIRVFAGIGVAAALLALTACRSSPAVAAYIGDEKLTEDRVTALIDKYEAAVRAQNPNAEDAQARPDRTVAVGILIRHRLCEAAQKKLNFQVEQPEIPPGAPEFYQIVQQTRACEAAVPADGSVKPTEADARQVYDIGVANGVYPPGTEAEQVAGLVNNPQLANALGRKKTLNDAISGINVTVNPRYGEVQVPLIPFDNGAAAVFLAFGNAGPVANRPVEASPPPQPQPAQ